MSEFTSVLFGCGIDGEKTFTDNDVLTNDKHYTNCTISAGKTLSLSPNNTTRGFRLLVSGTLTLEDGASITLNGNDGVNQTAGSGRGSLASCGYSVGGGAGANANSNGIVGTKSFSGESFSVGGVGGRGGDSSTHTGASGGTQSYVPVTQGGDATQSGALRVLSNYYNKPLGYINAWSNSLVFGGTGGGSGGGDETGSKKSGAGGGGGGVVVISAKNIVVSSGSASISAHGGKGGDAESADAGCGAGGGGGVILLYSTLSSLPSGLSVNVSGGEFSSVGSTTNAVAATSGKAYLFNVESSVAYDITPS